MVLFDMLDKNIILVALEVDVTDRTDETLTLLMLANMTLSLVT